MAVSRLIKLLALHKEGQQPCSTVVTKSIRSVLSDHSGRVWAFFLLQ